METLRNGVKTSDMIIIMVSLQMEAPGKMEVALIGFLGVARLITSPQTAGLRTATRTTPALETT